MIFIGTNDTVLSLRCGKREDTCRDVRMEIHMRDNDISDAELAVMVDIAQNSPITMTANNWGERVLTNVSPIRFSSIPS